MKTMMLLRLTTLLAVLLFAGGAIAQDDVLNRDFGIGGGGGGSNCSTCQANQSGYTISLSCASAEPGGSGSQYCRIENYPEGSYCFLDGDECCVD